MMRKIRRLTALLCAAAILPGYAAPAVLADPSIVTISTPDELRTFLKGCTSDEYSRGRTFVMYNDIDMKGESMSGGGIFCGVFMGNGHSIKNISLNFREANGGLFSNIGTDGEIRDLNLSGEIVQLTNSSDGISTENIVGDIVKNAGISGISPRTSTGITGAVTAVNSGLIVNCSFEGRVSGQKMTGGIVGQNKDSGTIDTCANAGEISGIEETGGIVGENAGVVKNSRNVGKINPRAEETTKDTGGIAGFSSGVIEYCANEGEAGCEGYGTNTGGIAGKQNGALIECENTGLVGAKKNAGGIVGIFVPFTNTEMMVDDIKDEWNKQKDDLKSEADKLRDRLRDTIDDLTDDLGIFNRGLPFFGSSENGDRLADSIIRYIDKAADRRTKETDALTNGINSLSDLNDSLRSAIDDRASRRELENQLVSSLDSMSASVTQVSDSMSSALDRTEEMADSVSKLTDNMTALTNDTSALLGTLTDTAGTISGNSSRNSKSLENVSNSLSDALDRADLDTTALDDAARALLNLSRTLDDVVDDLSDLNEDAADAVLSPFKTLQKQIQDVTDRINKHRDNAEQVKAILEEFREQLRERYGDRISDLIPTMPPSRVGKTLLDSLFTTAYAADDDDRLDLLRLDEIIDTERIKEEMKKAISIDVEIDRHIAGEYADAALVKYCVNKGEVRATENAGGVAGNMGVETLRKSGETYQLPDGKTVVSDLAVKATVHSCVNDGDIYAKERHAGGIVGTSNVGLIKSCLGAGDVCADNSGYAGGIGGDMNADIIYSIGAARLSGKNDLGGIAGAGSSIRECYSLASFDGDAERIGMIAGSADGEIKNNCFISEEVGGIGGASYENNAQNIAFEKMKCTTKLPESMTMFFNDDWTCEDGCFPQIKSLAENDAEVIGLKLKAESSKYAETSFTVNFIVDGETVKTLKKEYNEKLSESEVPQLTGKDGRYPHWNRDTTKPIRRHTNFKTEYNDATMTIASDEDPPIVLVEGNFSDKTTVTVTQSEVTSNFTGYTKGKAYSFKIEPKKDAEASFRLHVLSREKENCAIGIVEDGRPRVISCDRDGSYLVCEMDKPQTFVILSRPSGAVPIIVIIIIAAIAAALAGVFGIKGGKRIAKKRKAKKNDNAEKENAEPEKDGAKPEKTTEKSEEIPDEPEKEPALS